MGRPISVWPDVAAAKRPVPQYFVRRMDKKDLSESDICMKFIDPAIAGAGWSLQTQVRREVTFTDGKVIVRGKLWKRGKRKRADYVLFWKKNLPLAVTLYAVLVRTFYLASCRAPSRYVPNIMNEAGSVCIVPASSSPPGAAGVSASTPSRARCWCLSSPFRAGR